MRRRKLIEIEARLAENESMLTPVHIGRFMEEGLAVYTVEEAFTDPAVADTTPYRDIAVYYFTERALPQRAGKEEKLLTLGGDEGKICLSMNDRTEALALAHGVKAIDRRFPAEKQKALARFYYRSPHYGRKMTILFVLIALLLTGLLVAGALLGGFERGAIASYAGVCLLVLACSLAPCAVLLRREKLVVYERGIRLHFFLRGCNLFLPVSVIQSIRKEEDGMVADVGFTDFILPDGGAYEFLRMIFPEKCGGEGRTL